MSSWAIVAIIAIVVWGLNQWHRTKNGIVTDEYGNESRSVPNDTKTMREIEELRERILVLERIATDGNSLDARETKRIAAEIEALRDRQAD
jgi:hypothetical protein